MDKDNDPRGCSATDQQIVESCVCFDSCVHDPSPNLFVSNEASIDCCDGANMHVML